MTSPSKTTLTQWTIFNAVIDHGGYLKAAEKLNRSHSSLHHAVQKLQQSLGVELIEIQGKTPHLTATGEVMRRRSLQLLQDASALEDLAVQLAEGWEPEITLAVENIYPNAFLTPVLDKFHQVNQITRLKIIDVVLGGAVEMIEQARADLVISPIVPAGHLGTSLIHISLHPYAHPEHPLVMAAQPVTQRDLAEHLQIVISDTAKQTGNRSFGWLKAEQRWTVSDFHHALEILKSGKGFCWVPDHLAEDHVRRGELQLIETQGDLSRSATLSLVCPRQDHQGPGTELLAKLIRKESQIASASLR